MQKAPAGAGIFPELRWNVSLFRSYTGIHTWEITHNFAILTTHNIAVLGVFFCLMFIPVPAF
jgi:hypothetical protein